MVHTSKLGHNINILAAQFFLQKSSSSLKPLTPPRNQRLACSCSLSLTPKTTSAPNLLPAIPSSELHPLTTVRNPRRSDPSRNGSSDRSFQPLRSILTHLMTTSGVSQQQQNVRYPRLSQASTFLGLFLQPSTACQSVQILFCPIKPRKAGEIRGSGDKSPYH